MDKREYKALVEELLQIRKTMYVQEERLKELERALESFHAYDFETSDLHPASIKAEDLSPKRSNRSWWVLFEQYNGHYALHFLGIVLFFVGAFLSVNHAIKMGVLGVHTGIYGALGAGFLCAFLGAFLRKKGFMWSFTLFEGALLLGYGAFFVGFRDYALFSPLVTYGSLIALELAALLIAYKGKSRLFALLALSFGMYTLRLQFPESLLFLSPFSRMFIPAAGAFVVALKERWYSVALLSLFSVWVIIAFVHSSSYPVLELLSAFIFFTTVPLLYAWLRPTNGLREPSRLEAVVTGVAGIAFLSGPFSWEASSLVKALGVLRDTTLPSYINYSMVALITGFFFLLEQLLIRRRSDLFILKATFYGLFLLTVTTALLSLVPISFLMIHGIAWLCGGLWLWTRNSLWLRFFLLLEGYTLLTSLFHIMASSQKADTLIIGIGILAYAAMSIVSYLLGKYGTFPEKNHLSLDYRDCVYAWSSVAFIYAWLVATYYGFMVPYAGLVIAFYGACSMFFIQADRYPVTALVGYGSLGIGYLYALFRSLFFFEGGVHLWGMAPTPRIFVLKEATVLLGTLFLMGIFLYLGMESRKRSLHNNLYHRMQSVVGGMTAFLLFLLIRLYLIAGIQYYTLLTHMKSSVSSFIHFLSTGTAITVPSGASLERNILTAYYALTGLILVAVGSVYRHSGMRLLGILLLVANATLLLSSLGIRSLGLADELIVMGIGAMILGASLFYRRFSRK